MNSKPRRSGSCPTEYFREPTGYENYAENYGGNQGPTLTGNRLSFTSEPYLPSLLLPNHFNRILYGECENRSGMYNQCAEWGFLTDDRQCNVPAACYNPEQFTGTLRQ